MSELDKGQIRNGGIFYSRGGGGWKADSLRAFSLMKALTDLGNSSVDHTGICEAQRSQEERIYRS
jgi:hypothetical protein